MMRRAASARGLSRQIGLLGLMVLSAVPGSQAKARATDSASTPPPTTRPARAQGDVPLAATVGLSVGSIRETLLLVDGEGASSREVRSLTMSRVDLGLNYEVAGIRGERWRLRGQSSLGVGLVYALGEWPLHLRQDIGVELALRRWFGLFAYGSVGVDLNTSRPPLSAFVLALPVGLRFGPVELMARPALRVGLGGDGSALAGGTQRRSATTGIAPLELMLRVRIPIHRRR